MKREWTRGPQWVTVADRRKYEPMLARARSAWREIELLSVSAGVRDSALLSLDLEDVAQAQTDVASNGLLLTLLVVGGKLRGTVHHRRVSSTWMDMSRGVLDDETVGRLLGYPKCCREFFARTWAKGSIELIPAMNSIDGPWETNILLRYLGVRLVAHLPCSADCDASLHVARRFLGLGIDAGVDVAPLEELLRLPVSFDAKNGLAIVSTPAFRVASAADGGVFSASRGPQIAPTAFARPPATDHTGAPNGFASEAAMVSAHSVVLRVVGDVYSALDLGCGDGALLAAAFAQSTKPRGRWTGIENDSRRAELCRKRHPSIKVIEGSIAEQISMLPGTPYSAVIVMPGRLLEVSTVERRRILSHIRRVSSKIVAYAYGDWLDDGLATLAKRAGLAIQHDTIEIGDGVEAAVAEVSDVV